MERILPFHLQNAVDEFVRWRDGRKASYQTELQSFFHYTNASGLEGILKTAMLWFTHVEHLNDPSEFRFSYDIAVSELRCAQKQADPLLGFFLRVMLSGLDKGRQELPMYIGSFSRHGDYLGQWSRYADNGRGFCIQFSEQLFLESKLDSDPLKNHLRIAMEYDAERARRELKDGTNKVIELLKRGGVKRECTLDPDTCKAFFVPIIC